MRFILLFFAILCCTAASAQDGYYLTKEQHEQIKKNLKDYRVLIYNFDDQKREFEKLKSQFELLRKMNSDQSSELMKLKTDNIDIHNLNVKVSNLEEEKLKLNEKISSLLRELEYKNKSLNSYKSKYLKEYASNRGDRIIKNSIWATFSVFGLWAIYTSIEANYGQR